MKSSQRQPSIQNPQQQVLRQNPAPQLNQPELILQQRWEDLMEYIFPNVLENIAKCERFVLGADIRRIMWDVEGCLIEFSFRYGNRRAQLDFVDINAKKLMAMIRLAIRLGIVPQKRHEEVAKRLAEIGRIVGGLKKTINRGRI